MALTAEADLADPESRALADGGLQALLGFHLRMANVAMYRDYATTLSPLDLTQRQVAILSLVAANPGTPQVAIAAQLRSDRATIMAMVDRLEARGLLTRERSKSDRRRQELILTPQGAATLDKARTLIAEHERRFTSRFDPAELAALFADLKRLHA
ncbi:MAG: MarR family transcriptional regulator [Alphaproteobacteria bacterium]